MADLSARQGKILPVSTSSPGDGGTGSSPDGPQVFWWRDASADVDVPRGHGIGWATRDGTEHGRLTLTSEHLRLDTSQIAVRLEDELGVDSLQQLDHPRQSVSPAVRLYAAGHAVAELDLAGRFDMDCVVGVAVELRGVGVGARIALQSGLTTAEQEAALAWAERQVDGFLTHSQESALEAHGWTQMAPSRWQITANDRTIGEGV